MNAESGAYEGGTARWAPQQQHPVLHHSLATPVPQIIPVGDTILLADRSYADIIAAQKQHLALIHTGTTAVYYLAMGLVAAAILVLVWVMFIHLSKVLARRKSDDD